jgi:hypothetical protein
MKTGSDASRPGRYFSECCLFEKVFVAGQTFTRCPECSSLTLWEQAEHDRTTEIDLEPKVLV